MADIFIEVMDHTSYIHLQLQGVKVCTDLLENWALGTVLVA
jgi:hypothetical protein